MPQKKGSKPIWVEGTIHAAFREKLMAEGWTWGITKKVESLMADYAKKAKEPLNRGAVADVSVEVLPGPGESASVKSAEPASRSHEHKLRRQGK